MKAKKAVKGRKSSHSSSLSYVDGSASGSSLGAPLSVPLSCQELVSLADRASADADPAGAAVHLRAALLISPDDASILESFGEVLIALDQVDEARAALEKSALIAPNSSAGKWMLLGQLSFGAAAVNAFNRGLIILKSEMMAETTTSSSSSSSTSPSKLILRRRVSDAYCSISELYMTDLCDEPDAETLCDEAACAAREVDDKNAEAWARSASLRLCQSKPGEADDFMARALSILRALDAAEDDEEEEKSESLTAATGSISFSRDFRLDTSRICMEMERYDDAAFLLDRLLGEDDTDMETWFLAAEAALLAGDAETAVDLAGTADAMLAAALNARGGKKGGGGGGGGRGQGPLHVQPQLLLLHQQQ